MSREIAKTLSLLGLHFLVGFSVAYAFTGSFAIAGGVALVEPLVNAVVFFFHERAWNRPPHESAPSQRTVVSLKSIMQKACFHTHESSRLHGA